MVLNVSKDKYISMTALVPFQSLIREAVQADNDTAAMALDALLAGKDPALQATAVAICYQWVKPYEVKS